MSYAQIIILTTHDNIADITNNNAIRFVNNIICSDNNTIRLKIYNLTKIDILNHEKPSSCIPICMFSYAKAKPKMQKRMQPNAIRFNSFDRQTVQISSRKGYLQHRISAKVGSFGYLPFYTYIYSKVIY